MKLDITKKLDTDKLLVGELERIYGVVGDGYGIKNEPLGRMVVVTENEDGNYVSVEDGTIYYADQAEIAKRYLKGEDVCRLGGVQSFTVAAQPYAKRKIPKKISKKALLKYQVVASKELEKQKESGNNV